MAGELEQVKDFWEQAACGEALFLRGRTREDYERQARVRYALEPFIPPFAEFERWRARDVLEIGVGLGADHQKFAEAGARLTGIDLTQRAIELVRTRFEVMGLPSNLRVANAEALPFADESFDLVYSWGVLHHSPNTPGTIDEVFRVLRPGGEARLMVYHHQSLVGYMLWLRYALLGLHPLMTLRDIYSRYLESPGTKAYTRAQAAQLMARFTDVNLGVELTHGDLLTSAAGQRHRGPWLTLARLVWPRWFIRRYLRGHGLFLMIRATKPMSAAATSVVRAPARTAPAAASAMSNAASPTPVSTPVTAAPVPAFRAGGAGKLPISIVMLSLNEEHNLRETLPELTSWAQEVFLVDSLSTDGTIDMALRHGATVVQRPFTTFGDQWNWALEHLDIKTPWTLKLDPDERIPAAFVEELAQLFREGPRYDAYIFKRRLWFMGRPLNQTQWVVRMWRTGQVRFSDVLVNEHPMVASRLGRLRTMVEHKDSPNLHHWFVKQNLYTTLQAIEQVKKVNYGPRPRLFGNALEQRTLAKIIFWRLPFRHLLMWLYLAVGQGALLCGRPGLNWVRLRVGVQKWVEYKKQEMVNRGTGPEIPQVPHGRYDPRILSTPAQLRAMGRAGAPQPVSSTTV
jgi:SAM-dependent methyltransferase